MTFVAPLRTLWRIRRLLRASDRAAGRGRLARAEALMLRTGVEWAALEWLREDAF